MPQAARRIGDILEVASQPTVVRLEHLQAADADWISDRYFPTLDLQNHLRVLAEVFARPSGCGVFVIGPYGSGKTHLLAYVAQQLARGRLMSTSPRVVPISLVHFGAQRELEAIVGDAVGLPPAPDDRARAWAELAARPGQEGGLVLVLDELSEFLRSKPPGAPYHEDVRFLQFLGEHASGSRLWVLAAMQEQIERTGALEHGQYRKIKDRYPVRLLLSSAHLRELVGSRILLKKPGYAEAVAGVVAKLRRTLPEGAIDHRALSDLYPLHPATIDLLEEIRGSFSHARGIVEFVMTRLRGDASRGIAAFVDEPLGSLLTADVIVEHFRDLLALQPEFLPIAQAVLPHFERRLPELFPSPGARQLAERLVALLVLVHLSPMRESLDPATATAWLAITATRVEPARNVQIVASTLSRLAGDGRYVRETGGRFVLDLHEQGGAELEQLVARELEELRGRDSVVLEMILGEVDEAFDPLGMRRGTWVRRTVRWHLHDRDIAVFVGSEDPPPVAAPGLCIRLPWGDRHPAADLHTLLPAPIPIDQAALELAALLRIAERPLRVDVRGRVAKRRAELSMRLSACVRESFAGGELVGPRGTRQPALPVEPGARLEAWLARYGEVLLAERYPSFSRFAPTHGPLSTDHLRQFLRIAFAGGLLTWSASEAMAVVREGYLVPMGLLHRKGRDYEVPAKLERRELVRKVAELLRWQPEPKVIYQVLSEPVYGLVPDQIHLLLLFLVVQGEIDLLDDGRSIRELYETSPKPLRYDTIVVGHGLPAAALTELQLLCRAFAVAWPDSPSIAAQRRAVDAVRRALQGQAARLHEICNRLAALGARGAGVHTEVEETIAMLGAFDRDGDPIEAFGRFLAVIGSAARLLQRLDRVRTTPEELERVTRELGRLEHLLAAPSVAGSPIVSEAMSALGPTPSLSEADALSRWLEQADAIVERWATDYRARHDAWWAEHGTDPLLQWRPPAFASSKHLALASALATFDSMQAQARRRVCTRLSDLRFSAMCSCGFDGEEAPLAALLLDLEALRQRIESSVTELFADRSVRERLAAAQREGVAHPGLQSYLAGAAPAPDLDDVAVLDRVLDGAELVRRVDADELFAVLGEGVWDRARLADALAALLPAGGPDRVRFCAPTATEDETLLLWSAKVAVEHAVALPAGLPRSLRDAIGTRVSIADVSPQSLARLDALGLPDAAMVEILRAVASGRLPLPDVALAPCLAALAEVLRPTDPTDPGALAMLACRLYREHRTLRRVDAKAWLARLDALAHTRLRPAPAALVDALPRLDAEQWIVVDALGLLLLPLVEASLPTWLPASRVRSCTFALTGPQSTTAAFYRTLADAGQHRGLHKIDAVDALVHARSDPFADLLRLCEAELGVAFDRLRPRLDPSRSIAIVADHGFRLSADGRRYEHGGPSTLERVVPLWHLVPA